MNASWTLRAAGLFAAGALAFGMVMLVDPVEARQPQKKPPVKSDITGFTRSGPARLHARPITVEAATTVNVNPASMVRISVDRENATYSVGETMSVTVKSENAGYLYVFNIDPQGEVACLYPNAKVTDNQISAQGQVTIPPPGTENAFRLRISKPVGEEYMVAVVTKAPIQDPELQKLTANTRSYARIPEAKFRQIMNRLKTGEASSEEGTRSIRSRKIANARNLPEVKRRQVNAELEELDSSYAEHAIKIVTTEGGGGSQGGSRRLALFVGVSQYKDQTIRQLSASHLDAEAFADVARGSLAFDEVKVLTNSDATLANVQNMLVTMAEASKPGDTCLIYWSGHGMSSAAEGGSEAFLVPHDGSLASAEERNRTMLSDKEFARRIQALDGRKVMVIVDTCHSAGQIAGMRVPGDRKLIPQFGRGLDSPFAKKDVKPVLPVRSCFLDRPLARTRSIGQKDAAVLAACTYQQFAFERRQKDFGVMTFYILERLRSGGTARLADVAEYVQQKVPPYIAENFPGGEQTPVFRDQVPPLNAPLKP